MPDIFATLIVTATNVAQARTIAAEIPGGEGMFTSELSATGNAPATHYISSGWIPAEIVDALTMCAVSELPPDEAMTDKGLKPCVPSAT
jgi:hypothetical protein